MFHQCSGDNVQFWSDDSLIIAKLVIITVSLMCFVRILLNFIDYFAHLLIKYYKESEIRRSIFPNHQQSYRKHQETRGCVLHHDS